MKRLRRLGIGVAIGIVALIAIIWLLALTLGDRPTLHQGKDALAWAEQLKSSNTAARDEARNVFTSQILPQLTHVILTDTNDSRVRPALVHILNGLPGVNVQYTSASGRRLEAVSFLGKFGTAANPALPLLIQVAQRTNDLARSAAVTALGEIHSEPNTIIPLLTSFLDDKDLNDEAAEALGHFGPLAKPAVPKILPLLKANDKDAVEAAIVALRQIDPEALAQAQKKPDSPK